MYIYRDMYVYIYLYIYIYTCMYIYIYNYHIMYNIHTSFYQDCNLKKNRTVNFMGRFLSHKNQCGYGSSHWLPQNRHSNLWSPPGL